MSKIDYQALREAAEKATCGAWSLEYGEERFDAGDALIHREVVGYIPICRIEGAHPESGFDEDFQMEQQANAEFIAAASPSTVLTLLDELEAANKHIAELESLKTPRLPHPSPVVTDEMTPEMMRSVQLNSELGAYAASNLSGAYDLFSEFWKAACRAAMIHGAETVSNRDDLTDDFISMLTGRAKYLREKGEIKSPYLLERAAAALKGENADTTAIPNGWKLVPIDPTKDMLLAGQSVVGFWLNTVHCYSKMLAAAPAAPQQEVK